MDTLDLRQGRPEGTGLARQRQADPKCKAAYPDLRNRFWALWAKLEATPIETPDATIGSDALFELFAGRNDWKAQVQGLTGYPPKIIAELEDGNPRTLLDLQADRIRLHPTPESVMAGLTGLDADILAFATDYLRLRTGARTGEALGAVLTQHFDGETFQRLAALSGMMDAGQLAQVFDRIGADSTALDMVLLEGFQTDMFACQEDMDINSRAGTAAVSARMKAEYGWPDSLAGRFETVLNTTFFDLCEEFEPHPRPGFHDPVTAPIPTLVMQGELDTQTAPSWGALMVSSLPKGRLVFFPETGHGTLAFSQCARDIGAAFIENPEATFDTSCADALAPAFILPDGSRLSS